MEIWSARNDLEKGSGSFAETVRLLEYVVSLSFDLSTLEILIPIPS
jgi:hypothetical protein